MIVILNNSIFFRVGIYLRLSNEDKDKINEDSESIKNQRNMLMQYIDERDNFQLVDEYCDEDLSGAGTYRPEFMRLIRDCKNHKIDIVLCKSQSRFSRDMEVIEKYIHNKFKEWNVRFIGVSDGADTNNSGNKKTRQINGLVNEWFLEDVSNNIRSAFASKMKQGEFISPFAPYGYQISRENNNQLIIDNNVSFVVKKIFDLYIKGLGYTSIANYLNEKHISSPSFYKFQKGIKLNVVSNRQRDEIKWNANAIKTILQNEVYLGHLVQGKRTTVSYKNHKIRKKKKEEWIKRENTHDAIIDKDIFYQVQKLMKERNKPVKSNGSIHLFSKKVICSECHCYMRKKNSLRHEYLVCSSCYNGNCNNKKAVRYDILESIILSEINLKIKEFYDKDILKDIFFKKSKFKKKFNYLEKEKKRIQSQIIVNKNYLKNLYEDKVNGVISLDVFRDMVSYYYHVNSNYLSEIDSINHRLDSYKLENDFDKVLDKYSKIEKLNRVIVQEFIRKIYVSNIIHKNRYIQIDWNF